MLFVINCCIYIRDNELRLIKILIIVIECMYYLEINVLGQLLVFFLLGLSQAILVFLKITDIIIVITMLVKNFNK